MNAGPLRSDADPAREALRLIAVEMPGMAVAISSEDLAALGAACAGDVFRCKRWIKRRLAGEPLAHIVGSFEFRGLRLRVDKRAYVTDPELTHLVDAVLAAAHRFRETRGREPLLAEVGVGCGALALAVQRARPDTRIVGLDIDSDALAVAAANVEALDSDISLVESDLFDCWPAGLASPDLIYGDPPWGDAETLYSGGRPASHYEAMPAASAFPLGGRTAAHAQVLRAARRLGWNPEIWLNGGSLPHEDLAALCAEAPNLEIVDAAPGVCLLHLKPAALPCP